MKTNLNEQKGSYAYELTQNKLKVDALYANPAINANSFKTNIIELVKAAHDTPAKRNFLMVLMKQRTKDDILQYLYNVILRADHLSANINDKWANER